MIQLSKTILNKLDLPILSHEYPGLSGFEHYRLL
jgi:hypothetical protein